MTIAIFMKFGVALAIGILIGLQREYASDEQAEELAAGVRTFTLMALSGCAAALASDLLKSIWPFVAVVVMIGGLTLVSYYVSAVEGRIGMTSEVAAVLTVLVGGLAYWDQMALAVALAVAITVILSLKLELQRFADQITREDLYATLKFAVITAIVLPVLPNQVFGPEPFNIFNPYKTWLMVVLISGISFIGYVLIKVVGARQGIGLTGFLGGLVSSTAVTLSFTQRSKTDEGLSKSFALAIMVAWTVMFTRLVIVVSVVNINVAKVLWVPVAAAMVAGLGYCVYLYRSQEGSSEEKHVAVSNPFELTPAIQFGLIFLLVLLVASVAQYYFQNTGLYIASILSGVADVDAITLSVSELASSGGLGNDVAARSIVFAAVSNTVAKGVIVLSGGAPSLRRAILPGFLLMMVTAVVGAVLLPTA